MIKVRREEEGEEGEGGEDMGGWGGAARRGDDRFGSASKASSASSASKASKPRLSFTELSLTSKHELARRLTSSQVLPRGVVLRTEN